MPGALRGAWRKWRERRRQYQLDRALYKLGGGRDMKHGGPDAGAAGLTRGSEDDRIAGFGKHAADE